MSDATQQQRLNTARTEWTRLFASATENQQTIQQRSDKIIALSAENMQTNTHWGDEIQHQKSAQTTRIYCQNVNGFKLDKEGGQYSSFRKIHQEIQADISCCQEINLDTTQHIVQNILHQTTKRHWERSRLTMGSTPISFSGQYKPGGTLILSTGAITGRIHLKGTDKWGRWSYHTLLGLNGRTFTVISAYQPIAMNHDNRGSYTISAQQRCLLLQSKDQFDNPRKAFRRDLQLFLKSQTRQGADILLLGDFNERMGDDPNGMSSIAAQFQLVDIMAIRHPTLEAPATYTSSKIHQEIQADISCCQEINLDTTQHIVQNILHQTTKRHWERSRLTMGSTPISFSGQYKPGGTLILSTGAITGRIHLKGTDKWGRWSYHTLLRLNGRTFTVISAYQPIAMNHDNRGSYTISAQQRCLLLQSKDQFDNPRNAFRRDLQLFLKSQTRQGADILLLGDFNERMGDDPNGMSSIAAQFQLVDIMAIRHPTLEAPATYARGRTRLDYALGTHRVAASVLSGGYESFNYRFHTDHRAYFLDFDTRRLFGSSTQQLGKLASRRTSFSQRHTIDKVHCSETPYAYGVERIRKSQKARDSG
jgi:exonuclease III